MTGRIRRVVARLKRMMTQPLDELSRFQKTLRYVYDVGRYGARQLQYDRAPQIYPLWGTTSSSSNGRAQYLYDVADIPISAGNLLGMSVRAPTGYTHQASTYQTTIMISMGPNAPSNANSVFTNNHGVSPATVVDSPLAAPPLRSTETRAPGGLDSTHTLTARFPAVAGAA